MAMANDNSVSNLKIAERAESEADKVDDDNDGFEIAERAPSHLSQKLDPAECAPSLESEVGPGRTRPESLESEVGPGGHLRESGLIKARLG